MVSSRPDTADLATLQKMRKAGIRWICFGVESGNQKILDIMHKNITLGQIKNVFEIANKAGLFIAGFYIIGALGETHETAMDTINLACKLKQDYATFTIAIPLPGTELYQYCIEKGLSLPVWNRFENLNTPPIHLNDSLSADMLMELRRRATNRFFKRPMYLLRIAKHFNAVAVVRDFVKMYWVLRREIKNKRY